ncbi:MAG: AI-2E family transporter [Eubacteriales bacterium]|nr:AI-2E family transporter [Eubacteriales bacterium]MDD3349581.1 AI-2E family transporter [Eubacteriales bacterium]
MSKLKELFSDWRYIKVCLYVVFTVGLLYVFYFVLKNIDVVFSGFVTAIGSVLSALSPLFIGLFLAYLLSPLVDFIDQKLMSRLFLNLKKKSSKKQQRLLASRRTASIVVTYLVVVLVICAIIYFFAFLIIGQLAFDSLSGMLDNITEYFIQYEDSFRRLAASIPSSGIEDKLQESAADIASWISKHFSANSVIHFIGNIGGGILNIVLGAVVSIYLIKDKDFFKGLWTKATTTLLPDKARFSLQRLLRDINQILSQFLRGQMIDALIIAILSSVGLTAIGLDFAVFIGCFAGLANVIPYFGPFLGMIPAVIVALLSGSFSQAILAVVVLFVIQQVDSNIIYPRVVGSSTGLHPVFILVAVTFGGYFWGIVGMLVAVPIAACIKLFLTRRIDATAEK